MHRISNEKLKEELVKHCLESPKMKQIREYANNIRAYHLLLYGPPCKMQDIMNESLKAVSEKYNRCYHFEPPELDAETRDHIFNAYSKFDTDLKDTDSGPDTDSGLPDTDSKNTNSRPDDVIEPENKTLQ